MRTLGIFDPKKARLLYDSYQQGGHLKQGSNSSVLKVNEEGLPEYALPEVVVTPESGRLWALSDWYHKNSRYIPRFLHRAVYNTIKDSSFGDEPLSDLRYNFIPNLIYNKAGKEDNVFLMSPKQQEKQLKKIGFDKVDQGYGLVNSAVQKYKNATGRDVPVYQYGSDDIVRDSLVPLRNNTLYPHFNPQEVIAENGNKRFIQQHGLGDVAASPFRLYRDNNGNIYYKRWDFFDHGDYSRDVYSDSDNEYVTGPLTQNSRIYGNMLDNMGNPFVKTTGYKRIEDPFYINQALQSLDGIGFIYGDEYEPILDSVKSGKYDYAKGGGIHIKHPGRLTALKKRTGKTEAELWRTGSKAVRKMITFARNARKWKHDEGGYLDDIIWDNNGQWSHPGQITGITGTKDGTDITMNGVADYLIGKDNLGNVKFMKPGQDYHFKGSSVVEYPLKYQFGGLFKKKETPNYLYSTYGLNDYGQPRYKGSYNNPVFGYDSVSGINQSVGRGYSMPDYNAVAIASTPIYMDNSVSQPGIQDKESLAKKYLADFVLQDGIENSMNSKYYNKKLDRWVPQDSVEGGAQTIGKGLKLNNTNSEWYKTLKKQGYLTNEQMEAGVNEMIGGFYGKARDIYNNRVGEGAWDKLDANKQALLMDYAYNGVLGQFNNFMDAVAANDKDKILKEYVRYSGGKKLGRRNEKTLEWINSIWQEGGLIKPFSYSRIPEVRFDEGGYAYIK